MAVTSAEEVPPPALNCTSDILVHRSAEEEVLPPALDSTSAHCHFLMEPPGCIPLTYAHMHSASGLLETTTLSFSSTASIFTCGLQDEIKLVPIDLVNRPAWYKEKVYPDNKVPSLEHNNKVRGESLDLIKYIDNHFEGPALYPDDPNKRQFAEELLSYTETFNRPVISSLKGDSLEETGAAFDYLETALSKFNDGPFFLGQFSMVDIAYAPFVEQFHPLLLDVKKYDITSGRPRLASWVEEMDKIEAYKQTKHDPEKLVALLKWRFMVN